MNPNTLLKTNAVEWGRKHAGHRKVQDEGLQECNGRDVVLLVSVCEECQEVYIYDFVFEQEECYEQND